MINIEYKQNLLLAVLLFCDFPLLSISRTRTIVNYFIFQGWILALLAFIFSGHLFLPALIALIKGVVIPMVIAKTIHETKAYTETSNYYTMFWGVIFALLGTIASFIIARNFLLPTISSTMIASALSMTCIGVVALVARKNAIYQILGYMSIENGLFLLTLPLFMTESFIVELLLLVEVLIAITVRKNAVYWISKEFASINVDQLSLLRD
ncbi:MAG: hypothetical protein HQK50_01600 [Oligoflexia bacterium]|nr:hypothetical protein [Oligoflexia bacterium]MBF0364232.1 hypothetical protein [Oligoflexia bacterium]